jgi:serine/threonine protein phosphatase PrpC
VIPEQPIFLDTGFATDRGPRKQQQDNVLVGERFVVVADGVAARDDSDVAAAVAVDVYATIARTSTGTDMADQLLRVPQRVAERLGELGSTGLTTAAAAMVDAAGRLWVSHVGDSQVLVTRRGKPVYISRPHTVLADAEGGGRADSIGDRERAGRTVTRSLGVEHDDVVPLVVVCQFERGDEVIVTTDGVHGIVPIDALIGMTGRRSPAAELAAFILDTARGAGLTDNATCAVLCTSFPMASTVG